MVLKSNRENDMSFLNRREGKDRRNPEKYNIDKKRNSVSKRVDTILYNMSSNQDTKYQWGYRKV